MRFLKGKLSIRAIIIFVIFLVLSRFGAVAPYRTDDDAGSIGGTCSRLLFGIPVGITVGNVGVYTNA